MMMKKTVSLLLAVLLLSLAACACADESNSMKDDGFSTSYSYIYDYWEDVQMAPDPYRVELIIDRNANLVGPLGQYELPTENGKPFLLEVWGDPRSRRLRVWVDGALVAEIAGEADDFDVRVLGRQLRQYRQRPVLAPVVDIQQFVIIVYLLHHFREPFMRFLDYLFFIVTRCDNCE